MTVRNIMTPNPQCCSTDTPVRLAARMMTECDCGEIPVLDQSRRPIGVATDRDICCRVVAGGLDVDACTVGECMSSPAMTIDANASLEECCDKMQQAMVRRIPVVDAEGVCIGIVSQADLARKSNDGIVDQVVKEVSRPLAASSALA